MRRFSGAGLVGVLVFGGLTACSEDAQRERDLKGFLQCIQLGQESCVVEMTCTAYSGAFTTKDLLDVAQEIPESNVQNLRFLGKDTRGDDEQYMYELDGKTIYVRYCPEGYTGSIATLVVSEKD